MSRFTKELAGFYGETWRQNAIKEMEKAKIAFYEQAYVDSEGIVRWKSNNRQPPEDMLEKMSMAGCPFNKAYNDEVREAENALFFEEYRKKRKRAVSQSEMYELEAAFGKGTKVVDVITGESVIVGKRNKKGSKRK